MAGDSPFVLGSSSFKRLYSEIPGFTKEQLVLLLAIRAAFPAET